MTSYKQIADNLRASTRADWCDKIEAADALLDALQPFAAHPDVAEHCGPCADYVRAYNALAKVQP